MASLVRRIGEYIRRYGAGYTLRRATEKLRERVLKEYDAVWRCSQPGEEALAAQRADAGVREAGLISVVIPVYNTRPELLDALVDSLLAQTYPDWEACLYDGCSSSEGTRQALERAQARDGRIHVAFGEQNEGISGNSNRALAMARGAWIALCDHDDLLTPDALYQVARVICQEQPEMIYSDEDKVNEDGTRHMEPHFKPDFCPDNLRSGNYICHLMVLRRTLVDAVGGFRPDFDGSQDHDLALRCSERTDRIAHIPQVLYHWRKLGTSMSHQQLEKCESAACRAVEEHITRMGMPGRVTSEEGSIRLRYQVRPDTRMELIVIDSGDPKTWPRFVRSMRRWHDYPVHRTVVSPMREAAADLDADWIAWRSDENVFACLNRAVARSQAEVVVILHSDVAMDGDGQWLTELLMYAQRDDVGAVTPVLYDGAGHIVHGGFAVGMAHIAQCRARGLPWKAGGWHGMMRTSHNVSAVSAACLMIRRDHFIPFDEEYRGGLGTVDWCLRLQRQGMVHVFTPHARGRMTDPVASRWLLLSRGPDEADAARFAAAWGEKVHDPCYSVRFSRRNATYALPGAHEEG